MEDHGGTRQRGTAGEHEGEQKMSDTDRGVEHWCIEGDAFPAARPAP